MAPTYVLAYNTTDRPVVVDGQGRTLGGHEWAPARRGDILDAAANTGQVVVLTTIDEESASDEARAAHHQAQEWTAAAEKWKGLDLEVVRDAFTAHQRDGNVHLPMAATAGGTTPAEAIAAADRADLVDRLVRANIPVPARRTRQTPQE